MMPEQMTNMPAPPLVLQGPNPSAGGVGLTLVLLLFFGIVWFLPSIVALVRGHPQTGQILGFNFFASPPRYVWLALLARAWSLL